MFTGRNIDNELLRLLDGADEKQKREFIKMIEETHEKAEDITRLANAYGALTLELKPKSENNVYSALAQSIMSLTEVKEQPSIEKISKMAFIISMVRDVLEIKSTDEVVHALACTIMNLKANTETFESIIDIIDGKECDCSRCKEEKEPKKEDSFEEFIKNFAKQYK